MHPDLTNVFKAWFEVAATPIDMAANAVKQVTQNHIQPFVDTAEESLKENREIINTAYPGVIAAATQDFSNFKDKIEQAADTTVDYSKRDNVPSLSLQDIPGYDYIPAADDIPGVQKIKQLTGLEENKTHKSHHKVEQRGGKRKRRRRKTKKRALKKRHHRRKTRHRRYRRH